MFYSDDMNKTEYLKMATLADRGDKTISRVSRKIVREPFDDMQGSICAALFVKGHFDATFPPQRFDPRL